MTRSRDNNVFRLPWMPGLGAERLLVPERFCRRLREQQTGDDSAIPLVRLHDPTGIGCWLISAFEDDRLFGLCDLGLGEPEMSVLSHRAISALEGPSGHRIRLSRKVRHALPLSVWARIARRCGSVVAAEIEIERAGLSLALSRTMAWEMTRA